MVDNYTHTPSHILRIHTHNLHADTVYFVPNYIPSFQHTKRSAGVSACCYSCNAYLLFFEEHFMFFLFFYIKSNKSMPIS